MTLRQMIALNIVLLTSPAIVTQAFGEEGASGSAPARTTVSTVSADSELLTCLTPEEEVLARSINELRKKHKLPLVPVTGALTKVAKWHVYDLEKYAPHKNTLDPRGLSCNLHSWSDQGKGLGGWQPVCYTSDHKYARGMWDKPREITDYRGDGYENIYWTNAPMAPSMAISMWENRETESALILEKSAFAGVRWRAMGVGLRGSYAAVWFGERLDPEPEIVACKESLPGSGADKKQ